MYFLHAINSDRQTRLLKVFGQIAMILGDKKKSYVLNMFRTLIYQSSEACDYIGRIVLGSMFVGSFGVVGLKHCFNLQHGYHSNLTTPKLQHTLNQEQYDQCGNSTD